MKDFHQLRHQLNESVFRKGSVVVFGNRSKSYGDKSVTDFKNSKSFVSKSNKDIKDDIEDIKKSISYLNDGLINQRGQLGSITSMLVGIGLFNQRLNRSRRIRR